MRIPHWYERDKGSTFDERVFAELAHLRQASRYLLKSLDCDLCADPDYGMCTFHKEIAEEIRVYLLEDDEHHRAMLAQFSDKKP